MAGVDITQQAVVVEIVPENTVAEFTDELVTVDVADGTPLVEFGGCGDTGTGSGAFYTGVNLGTGAPVYKETDDLVDPREHKFRTLIVDNVGTGAEVHRDTTTGVNEITANLRSVVGENGIVVRQDPDEIVIGIAGGGGGLNRPNASFVEESAPVCGMRTTSYTPSVQTPTAIAGDYAIWVTYVQHDLAVADVHIFDETVIAQGWLPIVPSYIYGPGVSVDGNIRGVVPHVMGKILTAEDIGTTFTITGHNPTVDEMCSRVFIYRGVHAQMPIASAVADYQQDERASFHHSMPVPAYSTSQPVLQIDYNRGLAGETTDPYAGKDILGPIAPTSSYAYLYGSSNDVPTRHYKFHRYNASTQTDENYLVGEAAGNSLLNAAWESVVCSAAYNGGTSWLTRLTAAAGVGRHYKYQNVDLTAGDKITFAALVKRDNNDSSGAWLTIADPLGNERGFGFAQTPSLAYNIIDTLDPLTDHNTVWHRELHGFNNGGSPSSDGQWAIIYFTAPVTGTYELRIGPTNGTSTSLSYTGSGNNSIQSIDVHHVLARGGYVTPYPVWTPVDQAAVKTDTFTGLSPSVGYQTYTGRRTWWSIKIVLNPAWLDFPLARVVPELTYIGNHAMYTADGKTVYFRRFGGDDYNRAPVRVDRPVFPTRLGAPGKYYFEFTALTAIEGNVSGFASLGVQSLSSFGEGPALINRSEGVDIYFGIDTNVAINDVIGVAIDYEAEEVKFYKNNVLVVTRTLSHGLGWPAQQPLRATWHVYDGYPYAFAQEAKFTLKPPFVYTPPAGFVEYDWLGNEVADQFAYPAVGSGLSYTFVNPDGTLGFKSFTGGEGIKITGAEQTLDWALNVPELTELAVGAVDRNNDFLPVYDASAVDHKKVRIKSLFGTGVNGQVLTMASGVPAWADNTGGGGGSGIWTPDTPPIVTDDIDDEFEAASLDAKWSILAGSTANLILGEESVLYGGGGTAPSIWMEQPITGTFKVRAKFWLGQYFNSNAQAISMFVRRTATNRLLDWGLWRDGGGTTKFTVDQWTAGPSWSSAVFSENFTNAWLDAMTPTYFEIEYDGTNIIMRRSRTGHKRGFAQNYTQTAASWLGGAPDRVGLFLNFSGAICDWFRRVA